MSQIFTDKNVVSLLGALNAELRINLDGLSGIRFDLRGAFTASVVLEATIDEVNWVAVTMAASGQGSIGALLSVITAPGNYISGELSGFTRARIRCSAYTSGTLALSAIAVQDVLLDKLLLSGLGDKVIVGPAAQSVLNTDLITGTVSGWYDVSTFNSGTIQIIGSAGISAGILSFECTNDITISPAGAVMTVVNLQSFAISTSTSVLAGATTTFSFPVGAKYVRARISTAFVGGTVQVVLALSQRTFVLPQTGIVSNADNLWYQESTSAQAANATITGAARDTGSVSGLAHRYSAFNAYAFADQAGTIRIEASNDSATWRLATVATAVAANTPVYLSVPVTARYHRAVFVNGATLQTAFLLNTSLTAA